MALPPQILSPAQEEQVTRTVFVGGLTPIINDKMVQIFFDQACGEGSVSQVCMAGQPGNLFCFVEFTTLQAAQASYNLTGAVLGEQAIKVGPAKGPILKGSVFSKVVVADDPTVLKASLHQNASLMGGGSQLSTQLQFKYMVGVSTKADRSDDSDGSRRRRRRRGRRSSRSRSSRRSRSRSRAKHASHEMAAAGRPREGDMSESKSQHEPRHMRKRSRSRSKPRSRSRKSAERRPSNDRIESCNNNWFARGSGRYQGHSAPPRDGYDMPPQPCRWGPGWPQRPGPMQPEMCYRPPQPHWSSDLGSGGPGWHPPPHPNVSYRNVDYYEKWTPYEQHCPYPER